MEGNTRTNERTNIVIYNHMVGQGKRKSRNSVDDALSHHKIPLFVWYKSDASVWLMIATNNCWNSVKKFEGRCPCLDELLTLFSWSELLCLFLFYWQMSYNHHEDSLFILTWRLYLSPVDCFPAPDLRTLVTGRMRQSRAGSVVSTCSLQPGWTMSTGVCHHQLDFINTKHQHFNFSTKYFQKEKKI